MVEGQLVRGEVISAVLALMAVARVDVRPRKGHVIEAALDLDVTKQPDDGWELETERNGADLPVVHRDDLDLPLAPERDGLLPVDDLERLVRRVEKQRLFHRNLILSWIVPDAPPKCQAAEAVNRIGKYRLAALRPAGFAADILRVLRMTPSTTPLGWIACASLAASVLSAACASSGAVPRPFPTPDGRTTTTPATPAAEPGLAPLGGQPTLIGTALSLRGIAYKNGGSDPSGFDCSGFTQYVFAQHGIALPRDVHNQFEIGEKIKLKDVRLGDLVFFHTIATGASHVGIVVDEDEFVHAPSTAGVVRVEHLSSAYWSKRFIAARRVAPQELADARAASRGSRAAD